MAYSTTLSLLSILPSASRAAAEAEELRRDTLLAKRLCQAARRGDPVSLGDPYTEPPAAGPRALLASLHRFEGLDLSITTRSPVIVRDLDLLAELDRRHSVTVRIKVTPPDAERDPELESRLYAVERLAAEGIATAVLVPWTPLSGSRGGEAALRRLFAAARDAGAYDLILEAGDCHEAPRLLSTFHRLRLEHGFPRPVPGRG